MRSLAWAHVLLIALAGSIFAGSVAAGVIEVKLGTTIDRTWEQVRAAGHAHGPKQEYVATSGETHVYLPYGKNTRLYDEARGTLSGPVPGSAALFHSSTGNDNAVLTFKLHFDQRIGTFRFWAGWSELALARNTVAGVEYSEDGEQWKTIREIKGSEKEGSTIVEPLVADYRATDLNTDTLYIRLYARDPQDPEGSGPGRWLKVRMSGDPGWGDAATTFFSSQLQVWIAPVKPGTPPRVKPAASQNAAKPVVPPASDRAGESGASSADPRDDASPWAIASGAEWAGEYPKFNPMLEQAGVKWLRLFPEWGAVQPRHSVWDWRRADAMAANARANGIHLTGGLWYFAPWASADGGTRKGPIKDMQYWRDYVSAAVGRYPKDIQYWEVWTKRPPAEAGGFEEQLKVDHGG